MEINTRITATYTANEIRALIVKDLIEKGYEATAEEVDFVINKEYKPSAMYESIETLVLSSAKVLVSKK